MDQLINRYKIEDKGLKVVIKELKQSLVARSKEVLGKKTVCSKHNVSDKPSEV